MKKQNIFFSREELFIINNSLNEVCNALDIYDFETRMGATREDTVELLNKIFRFLEEGEDDSAVDE